MNSSLISSRLALFFPSESSMTRLEDLSHELFYEIFPHLDGFDLYEAFAGLNSRFERVLAD